MSEPLQCFDCGKEAPNVVVKITDVRWVCIECYNDWKNFVEATTGSPPILETETTT